MAAGTLAAWSSCRIIQGLREEFHETAFVFHVFRHLLLLFAPDRGDRLNIVLIDSIGFCYRGDVPFSGDFRNRRRRFDGQVFEGFLDFAVPQIQTRFDFAYRQPFISIVQYIQNHLHMFLRRECASDKVTGDLFVFFPMEQNPVGFIHLSAGTPHLLVVVHHGSGPLEMDDETQVRFIKAHTKGHRCDQSLEFVLQQLFFENLPQDPGLPPIAEPFVGFTLNTR